MSKIAGMLAVGVLVLGGSLQAYQAEVLEIQGSAVVRRGDVETSISQGDLLSAGDEVEASEGATIDLSFDGGWNNTVRIEPNTKVVISEVFPTNLEIRNGGIYAKLKKLPTGSEFQLRTPTAVAAARGTEYRIVYANEQTQVYNFSDSEVLVYAMTGGLRGDWPQKLTRSQKAVLAAAALVVEPVPMTSEDVTAGEELASGIEASVEKAVSEGRQAQIPTVEELVPEESEPEEKEEKKKGEDWDKISVEAFSADAILSGPQGSAQFRVYMAPGKSRMESAGTVSIARLDRGTVWVVLPEQLKYIEQPITPEMAAQAMSGKGGMESRKDLGPDTVNGQAAEKFEVVLTADGQSQTVYQWMVSGSPVPVRMQAVDGSWAVDYLNVQVGPQPDALFELPDGYTAMEMPTLPQNTQALDALNRQIGEQRENL